MPQSGLDLSGDGAVPRIDPGRAVGLDLDRVEADEAFHPFLTIGHVGGHFAGEFGLRIGGRVAKLLCEAGLRLKTVCLGILD